VIAFDGVLHDGRTAIAVPVRVEELLTDVAIADGTVTARLPRASIVADAPIPGVPRTLRLPDGERIETADHAAVSALWPEHDLIARTAYALESRWWGALGGIALTAACVWLIVAIALPLGADPVARRISPDVERYLGKQALASLDASVLKPSQLPEGRQREWREKFNRFVAGEPGAERYGIVFRRAGAPNAFALPGGTIVVTDEMANAVGSDDELLAVLAHEIGHVRGRHAMRLVLQNSGIAVLMTALAGDAVGVTFLAIALPTLLVQSGYSRQFEVEADDYAFAHMKRHGVSPQAFADVMRRLEKQAGAVNEDAKVVRYLGTHPATTERIRRAEEAR
jgi:predicted Zn-dependent protease